MVNHICGKLQKAGLVNLVVKNPESMGITPAIDTEELTVGKVLQKIDSLGNSNFIPGFETTYCQTVKEIDTWFAKCYSELDDIPLSSLSLPTAKE